MRGEVLHYDEGQGFGFITGSDGSRYTFAREDLRRDAPMSKGTVVEFQPSGGQARDVFSIRAQLGAAVPSISPVPPPPHFGRDAVASAPAYPYQPPATDELSLWGYFWRGITRNYTNFQGRARRREYWGYVLFWFLAFMIVFGVAVALDEAAGNLNREIPAFAFAASGLYILATFLPGLAMTIRRQHDIGLSGWFYLLILLPSVGSLIIFIFTLIPSQKHENKWGPIPPGVRI